MFVNVIILHFFRRDQEVIPFKAEFRYIQVPLGERLPYNKIYLIDTDTLILQIKKKIGIEFNAPLCEYVFILKEK